MEQDVKSLIVIEGGGSTCRGLTYDLVQNRIKGPLIMHGHPCNLHRDRDLTLYNIEHMLDTLEAGALSSAAPLTLCLPGISNTDNVQWLKAALKTSGFDTVQVASDAVAALLGAYPTLQEGQGIFIGGTGSMALGYAQGQLWRLGTPETERACGSWIARRAWELRENDPALHALFEQQAALSPLIAGNMNHAPYHILASYAPAIFKLAGQGHAGAEAILQEAAAAADTQMHQMRTIGITQFVLCGSVAQALAPRLKTKTTRGQGDGVDGALRLALSVLRAPAMLDLYTTMRCLEDEPLIAPQPHSAAQ